MGSEFAIPLFGPLIIVGVMVLFFLAFFSRSALPPESALLGLGRRRIAAGYLGVLLVLVLYNYVDTVDLSREKVRSGELTTELAAHYFWGWYVFGLCLTTPFVVFFLTALGLPLLALLRRFGVASILGGVIASQFLALCLSVVLMTFFENQWCGTHTWQCFRRDFGSVALLAGAVALGFVLAARLPLWRSSPMPANHRWRGP